MKNPLKGLEAHPFITRATEGRQPVRVRAITSRGVIAVKIHGPAGSDHTHAGAARMVCHRFCAASPAQIPAGAE